MKSLNRSLICACIAVAAGSISAQDTMKKPDTMTKDGMASKDMTMQQCKDHMAMMKKNTMNKDVPKRDDAMMKHDAMCADMMKKDGSAATPMKK